MDRTKWAQALRAARNGFDTLALTDRQFRAVMRGDGKVARLWRALQRAKAVGYA